MSDTILLNLAVADHEAGRLDRAVDQYRRILCFSPANTDALYLLGFALIQQGSCEDCASLLGFAVSARPGVAKFYLLRGEALRAAGDLTRAREAYESALVLDTDDVETLNALGLVLRDQGDTNGAIGRFDDGLSADPQNGTLLYNRAMTLQMAGRLEAAVAGYNEVLDREFNRPDALNNRARALQKLGRLELAGRDYRRLLVSEPSYAIGWNNLGMIRRDLGLLPGAMHVLQRARTVDPCYAEALNNLGIVLWESGEEKAAIVAYRTAMSHSPQLLDASLNLASALAGQGRSDEAIATYAALSRRHPSDGRIKFREAMVLPQVYSDLSEVDATRARVEAFLNSEMAGKTTFEDPVRESGTTSFYLAYHGRNDRSLAEKIVAFYRRACPRLSWTAPNCQLERRKPSRRRPRLGICSKYLNRHTIGLLFEGVIKQLAERRDFELVIIRVPGREDELSARIDAVADAVIRLPVGLVQAQNAIAEADLDFLLYTDIGLEPLSYFLAFARLAPIQYVTWGHPVTSGLDSLDGYLSADAFEPEDGDKHYSEGLVRMRNILMHYRPPASPNLVSKEEFGLSAGETVYVCPQNVFKLHPDYDAWLADVLRADPTGRLVLIEATFSGWSERLRARLEQSMPDVWKRVTFLPHLPTQRYFQLLTVADVVLDPIHFGGGLTTFHSLSFGTPVITISGDFQRSRFASGVYQLIGVRDLIARDKAGYVDLAVGVGQDASRRAALSKRIQLAACKIQQRAEPADELAEILLA